MQKPVCAPWPCIYKCTEKYPVNNQYIKKWWTCTGHVIETQIQTKQWGWSGADALWAWGQTYFNGWTGTKWAELIGSAPSTYMPAKHTFYYTCVGVIINWVIFQPFHALLTCTRFVGFNHRVFQMFKECFYIFYFCISLGFFVSIML